MSRASSELSQTSTIVRAGAGAGKTYTLTHRVMDIASTELNVNKKWPRVVVTTFTRKATQELRERLMLLALHERLELTDFVNSRAHLVVSTIHGVLDLFLKRYGSNIGIDPGYSILSTLEAERLARQTLRSLALSEFSEVLNHFQFNELTDLMRELARLRVEQPASRPVRLDDFLSIVQQRARVVSSSLEQAAESIRSETTSAPWLEMADAFAAAHRALQTFAADASVETWSSARQAMLQSLPARKVSLNSKNPQVEESTDRAVADALKEARDLGADLYEPSTWPRLVERAHELGPMVQKFSDELAKQKRTLGALEIADLESLAMQCALQFPEAAQGFASEWDYWLIDEYQDTSPFQVRLLDQFTAGRPCFIVGDPQQSIYLFRGARTEVFAQRENEIRDSGGETRLLSVNRRSRSELLMFINEMFAKPPSAFRSMDPHFSGDRSFDSNRRVAKIAIYSAAVAATAASVEPEEAGDADRAELEGLRAYVRELLDQGASPAEIAVLARKNQTLVEVAEFLAGSGLPTYVHASAGFFDRREIRDALSLLQFLVNPHDNRNTVELLRSPWFRVSDQTLIESVHRSGRSTWAKINEDNLCLREPAIGLLRSLARLAASEVGVTAAFRRGLIQSGLIDLAHQHDASGRREANLWKLLARLDQEERASGFNAISFVHRCLADIDMNEGSSEGDAVAAIEPDRINLMTVHASKGLEFKHVILPRIGRKASTIRSKKLVYLEDEKIWSVRVTNPESDESSSGLLERVWRDRQTRAEAEESERVFYVAATRAAETLYMSWVDEPDKTSWAQLLRLDLSPGSHKLEKFTYEVQHTPVAPNASHASAASVEEAVLRDGVRAPWRPMHVSSASGTSRASTSVSVTSILDAEAIDKNDQSDKGEAKSNALLIERLQTANRGTQVHRLMELMKYPSRSRIEQLVKKWFPENENEVVAAIEYVQTLKQPNLAAIIENGEVEWGFAFDQNGSVIEGQIDLWGRDSNGKAWIIDYKTGSSRHREKAFQQMSIYAFALYRSGLVAASESISLAAVYPFDRDAYVKMSPPFLDLERQFKNYFLGVSG